MSANNENMSVCVYKVFIIIFYYDDCILLIYINLKFKSLYVIN